MEGWKKDSKAQVGGRISVTVENICVVISTRMEEEANTLQNLQSAAIMALSTDTTGRRLFTKYCIVAWLSNSLLRILREELQESGYMTVEFESKKIIKFGKISTEFVLVSKIYRQSNFQTAKSVRHQFLFHALSRYCVFLKR